MAERERSHTRPRGAVFVPRVQVMSADDVRRAVTRMAHEIAERTRGLHGVVLIGLQTGGVGIAHRLADTVAIARKAGVGVVMDLFGCWFDADIDEAIAAAAPLSAMVQVSDYVYGDRGLPCRAVPGDGAVPWQHLVARIAQAGFTGWFDLEIIGPRLQAEGVEAGLTRAAQRIGAWLEGAGRPA